MAAQNAIWNWLWSMLVKSMELTGFQSQFVI